MRSRTPSSKPRLPAPGRLENWLESRRALVERELEAAIPRGKDWPPRLVEAMRYSLLSGGKRLRPLLALAAAEACGGRSRDVLPAACALECIHAYSLIHDDLPAMDDDDFRRGRPTSHRVFGEALAILAGDALLTLAFELLAARGRLPEPARLAVIREISRAAGGGGMVGGQVADMEAQGKRVDLSTLTYIHTHKTGALITAAVRAGALAAGAGPAALAGLTRYGRNLGAAFQIVDDLLDEEGELARLGKTPGSDRRKGKATWPALAGLEASRAEATRRGVAARRALAGTGPVAWVLEGLVGLVLERRN